ncbi:MAG: hypothetical protein HYZ28_15050 [Myxococcales bacterium]|nr:hypothetical protein [Myxococcales bacterium]
MQRLRPYLLPIAFCVGGLVLAHHETVLTGFAFTQNDLGDTRFNNYLLEHGWRWLLRRPGHLSLWDPPFFHPVTNVLAYSDPLLGAGPPYWIWRALGVPPDTSFQLWVLSVGALNFATCYLLLRRGFGQGQLGAAAGSALFAFAGTRINQTMHHQLFPHFWTMICLFAVSRLFSKDEAEKTEQRRILWIWAFALSAALQLWAGYYLGWFLVLGLAVAFAWAMAHAVSRRAILELARGHPYTLFLAAATSGLILAPMATHLFEASKAVGVRTFGEALTMLPAPATWLHLGRFSWLYGWMAKLPAFGRIPMEHEQRVGFGLATSALCAYGLWQCRKSAAGRVMALSGLTLLVAATLFGSFSAWKLVFEYFPGAQAVRAVARISIFLLVPLALGLSEALRAVAQRGKAFAVVALGLGAFSLLEQGQTTPAFDKHRNRFDVSTVAKGVTNECGAFVFSPVQGYGPYWKYQLDAMWASLESGVPTLNGYSGNNPPGWPLGSTNLHSALDEARTAMAIQQWIQQERLDASRICWVKLGLQEGPYAAAFAWQEVPAAMRALERYKVSVTMRNIGSARWMRGQQFRLGSQAPRDNLSFGLNRVELPDDLPPGGTVTFPFEVVAPAAPGRHSFQWRMVRDGVMWFGELTPEVAVTVEP